jgi:hypothetical protein
MYPLRAMEALRSVVPATGYVYIGCASFEPRWSAFVDLVEGEQLRPAHSVVLFPGDSGSAQEEACTLRQQANWQGSAANIFWKADRVNVSTNGGAPWHVVRSQVGRDFGAAGSTMVVDITTMPRLCFFPLIAAALAAPTIRNLVAVYSEPKSYGKGELESEPLAAMPVPPFDRFPTTGTSKQRISWLPILGFGPHFATTIYESLVDSCDLGGRVYPLVGFPAYQPQFFERVFNDSARHVIQEAKQHSARVRDQFRYAAANDPFETRDTILHLMEAGSAGDHWVGSPMGPKPMALGMLLAAVQSQMTVMISPAKTYDPDYSTGHGPSHGYILKRDGVPA